LENSWDNKTLLKKRIDRFDRLVSDINCERPTSLSAIAELNETDFNNLILASKLYLSKVLKSNSICLSEDEIIKRFNKKRESIPNITPTGMILPKRYSSVEYNFLMMTFYNCVSKILGQDKKISHWHIPMHIRVKFPKPTHQETNRPRHAPEHIHMDSWSSYSSYGVTCIIPLIGDVIKNSLDFWELNTKNYDEKWISPPLKNKVFDWNRHNLIIKNYKKVSFERRVRQVFLFDASTVHATSRIDNCGTRFSIDNIFIPKLTKQEEKYEQVSPERSMETKSHSSLLSIGKEEFFYFPDSDNDIRDTRGGSIDPINWRVIKFNDDLKKGRF
jgi:hypothetical protein